MTVNLDKLLASADPTRSMSDDELVARLEGAQFEDRVGERVRASSDLVQLGSQRPRSRRRYLVAVAAAAVIAGVATMASISGAPTSSAAGFHVRLTNHTATEACNGIAPQYAGMSSSAVPLTLIGSYRTTAGQITTWDENRPGQAGSSKFASLPPDEMIDTCFFSGDFTGFPGPPGVSSEYQFIAVMVYPDGTSALDFAGPASFAYVAPPTT